MSLLQDYNTSWQKIKYEVNFIVDNNILKYGINQGYSPHEIKKEILNNSTYLKGKPQENVTKYLSDLIIPNLQNRPINKANVPFNYNETLNKLITPIAKFYAEKELIIAKELLNKGYKNLEIQEIIKNKSPFFKNLLPNNENKNALYINIVLNKFPSETKDLKHKEYLNIYTDLANIEKEKNGSINDYIDCKIALSLYFDKNVPIKNIKKIFTESTINKNAKQPSYGEKIYNDLLKIIDKYNKINNFNKQINNNSDINEHYFTYVKQYLYYQNKKYLNGRDEQQIIKRLFAAKFNAEDIKKVIYNNSPVALETGRNAQKYILHNMEYVQKDYNDRVLKAKEHFKSVTEWFISEYKNIKELKQKDTAKHKPMSDIFYYGLLAKKLIEKGAYPQYIIKCFEGEIPSLKAQKSTNDNFIYAIVDGAQKAATAQKAILNYISPYKFHEMNLQDIREKNISLSDVFKSVIKERIDIYPNATLNLSKKFIDKDACVKLLNRYPDIKKEELIQAIFEASIYNKLPGVDRDYPQKIVQEAIEKFNEANRFIENEKELQENLREDFNIYKAVNLGGIDEPKYEENQKEYCDCKAAITMIKKEVNEIDIKNILADESTEKELNDKYKYADYIYDTAKKIVAREIQILNYLPIKKDPENLYKQYVKDEYLNKHYFAPELDINATKKLLNDNVKPEDIAIILVKYSPIVIEPKKGIDYINNYILKKAQIELAQEKDKLLNYQPKIRQETDINEAYKHHMEDFIATIKLPYSKVADEIIANAMLLQKFSENEVSKTLTQNSPLSSPTPTNLKNNTYGKEILKNVKTKNKTNTNTQEIIRVRELKKDEE